MFRQPLNLSREKLVSQGFAFKCILHGYNESMEGYLARLTHLTLNEQNIGRIDMLRMTPGVRVLYLYDNVIRRMNAFDSLTKLTHLYLQNNLIERITGLERLTSLTKLYLDGNRISYVDGLERCGNLEELHVSGGALQVKSS
jgi:Leucine-rich repeat (LRR) protein